MKKLLIGTSALVAAAAFSGAAVAAEPIKLSVGGYGAGYVVYASQKDSFLKSGTGTGTESNAVDVKGDNEVHFKGKTTLDNGLTVSVVYEFEAGGRSQDNINDEWTIATSGAFGTVQLAANDTASDALGVSAPGVVDRVLGGSYDNDIVGDILLTPATFSVDTSTTSYPIGGDAESISYFTPALYGFTAGVSYHPSASLGNNNSSPSSVATDNEGNAADGSNDAYTAGIKWEGSFSGVDVSAGVGAATIDPTTGSAQKSHDEWNAGAQIGYKGFSVGGSYRKIDIENATAGERKNLDGNSWVVGVAYTAAPYAVSLDYQSVEAGNTVLADKSKDKYWAVQLSGKYTMGPGVDLEAAVAYAEAKDGRYNNTNFSTTQDAYKNSSWIVGTGISLQF